jgi:hypothetical protein
MPYLLGDSNTENPCVAGSIPALATIKSKSEARLRGLSGGFRVFADFLVESLCWFLIAYDGQGRCA